MIEEEVSIQLSANAVWNLAPRVFEF